MDYINPANLPIISLNITLQSEVNHFTTRWHRRIDRLTCINVNIIVIARVSTLRIHIKEHDDSMIKWKIINNFLDFRINFELDFFFFLTENGERVVIRQCSTPNVDEADIVDGPCSATAISTRNLIECYICSTDLCNSAMGVSVTRSLFMVTLTIIGYCYVQSKYIAL